MVHSKLGPSGPSCSRIRRDYRYHCLNTPQHRCSTSISLEVAAVALAIAPMCWPSPFKKLAPCCSVAFIAGN